MGRKRCMMNMTTLQSRMNMPRTEMAMLKVVVLLHISQTDTNTGTLSLERRTIDSILREF